MRAAVRAHAQADFNTTEAARKLGLSRQTVQSRLQRAKTLGITEVSPEAPPTVIQPPVESPAAKLRFTVRQQADRWGDRYRVVVIFDIHDSPSIRKDRFKWIGRYIHENNPDCVVQIGDMFSFDSLCRFEPNESLEGRYKPVFMDDIDSGHEALTAMDKGLDGWKGEKHETLGNHEARAIDFTSRTPEIAGILTHNLDNLLMTHGWTYSPFGALHFIGGVAFTHIPLNRMGKPMGGEHVENQIGPRALEDLFFGHTHRAVDKPFSKTGTNRSVRVLSGGCSLEYGHIEKYVGHAMSGWSYNIADVVIDNGRVRRCDFIPMEDLAEKYGD